MQEKLNFMHLKYLKKKRKNPQYGVIFSGKKCLPVRICELWIGAQISFAPIIFSRIFYADFENVMVWVPSHRKKNGPAHKTIYMLTRPVNG